MILVLRNDFILLGFVRALNMLPYGLLIPNETFNNLEQVERRATRFILGRDYSQYERLSKLNLLPLKYRREINHLVFFCVLRTYIKHNLNIFAYVLFRSCTKPLRTVDHLTLDVPFSRTEVFFFLFFVLITFIQSTINNQKYLQTLRYLHYLQYNIQNTID